MSAEGQALVGSVALAAIGASGLDPAWIGGLTMGADPISYAIAHRSWLEGNPLNAFSVRKEAKSHGMGQQIEGGLPEGARVLVIEDSLSTGGSAVRAVEAVRRHGAVPVGVFTLVDREAGGRERIAELGLPLIRLFRAAELLDLAGHSEGPSTSPTAS